MERELPLGEHRHHEHDNDVDDPVAVDAQAAPAARRSQQGQADRHVGAEPADVGHRHVRCFAVGPDEVLPSDVGRSRQRHAECDQGEGDVKTAPTSAHPCRGPGTDDDGEIGPVSDVVLGERGVHGDECRRDEEGCHSEGPVPAASRGRTVNTSVAVRARDVGAHDHVSALARRRERPKSSPCPTITRLGGQVRVHWAFSGASTTAPPASAQPLKPTVRWATLV